MSFLVHLDLSYNKLTGRVPDQIGDLQKLVGLDLSCNNFIGPIPDTIGQLGGLGRNLDLSGNSGLCLSPSEANGVFIGVGVCGINKTNNSITMPFKKSEAPFEQNISFFVIGVLEKDPNCTRPFEGLKFVDVGCGGGILSETMEATVTGVDAVDKNITIARLHADLDPQTTSIEYRCTTAETLVEEQRQFDAVLALEVIEHVADPAGFCKSLSALTIPGGDTVISTINRSMRAYATAIVAAEYLLHWLPKGTHQWSSFLTPEELVLILQLASISVQEMAGFVYNALTGRWSLSDDISVNFIAFGAKPANREPLD
ncbi:hypothetical protein K7X08_020674 [Anisodus acutangulus]|uniref:3-demethylubiquinol 3-O-methyltransferase n=1 Tax=Anisodus acutangulus TaxID=402998 RepID=A0A9Q1MT09_9SOLA|nr:hypothetical protein K7X08_020674 [Anisodus acutangulus]